MKKHLFNLILLLFASAYAMAQESTLSGTVTAKDDGAPLPGVSVIIKGTTRGSSTGVNGQFSISATPGSVVQFKSLGFVTQEVTVGPSATTVNIVLVPDARQLGEIVVTALGISRESKTVGYATSTVRSAEINASSSASLFGGIQGKVAGVNISNTSGSPGGTTKVILRGYHSINSNAPLYVVDGVPLDNSRPASDNNYDFGNNANDIDPNDIESMNILKGSNATGIYGSRGANGVIVITTKKGKAGNPSVSFTTGTTLTNLALIYKPQETFGQGWDGVFILSENGNWGPAYDNKLRPWGAIYNNSQLLKPYTFIENNVKDAFSTGVELNNNITLSGGTERSTYYFSYGNIFSDGILPSDNDSYKRNNFSLKGSTTFKGFTASGAVNYVAKNTKFVESGQGAGGIGSTFYESLLQIPGDVPIKDLKNYSNDFFNVDNYFTPFAENPYYSLYENGSKFRSDRIYGNVNLGWKVNSWLDFQIQQGLDITQAGNKMWHNSNAPTPGSWNAGSNVEGASRQADIGDNTEESAKFYEYDTKINALFKKAVTSDFSIDGLIGVNYNDRGNRQLSTTVEGLVIPGFFQMSNAVNKPVSGESLSHRRLFGAYATATMGYKDYLYLTLTGRNDWSSTLPINKNSFFYPGANLAFVVSDLVDISSTPISFLKLRASYGQTGNDTAPYRTANVLNATSVNLGFGSIAFPINQVAGFSIANQLNNANLKPEKTTEVEFGGEVRLFGNRISLDANYYRKITDDQILPVAVSPSSGYSSIILNATKVRNKGIEILFNATPVKSSLVSWDLSYTFARDRSMVLELAEGLDKLVLNSAYDAQLVVTKGQPLGVIQAPTAQYDPSGRIIVDHATGFPVPSATNKTYGAIQSDYQMGLTNSIKVKGFTLGFTFDYRHGGVFYSGTADLLNFVGADKKTLYNGRSPFIVPNSVQAITDGGGNVTYVENTVPVSEQSIDDYYYPTTNKAVAYENRILSKTYLKLREATLSYSLPKSVTAKLRTNNAVISVFGRNLHTWLPKENRTIDPEVTNLGGDIGSELGEFRTSPPMRYFGASLRVSF